MFQELGIILTLNNILTLHLRGCQDIIDFIFDVCFDIFYLTFSSFYLYLFKLISNSIFIGVFYVFCIQIYVFASLHIHKTLGHIIEIKEQFFFLIKNMK